MSFAATYFDALHNEGQDSYQHTKESFEASFCPAVDRKRNFAEFAICRLKLDEDPTIFLWKFKDVVKFWM